MISNKVLDKVIPLPTNDELMQQVKSELEESNFPITNFKSGGIFYTILQIIIHIKIELLKLCRTVLNNMYITHAEDVWIEIKAADFSKSRKPATKTQGNITVSRNSLGDGIRIKKGMVFRSDVDINDEVLNYIVTSDVVMTNKMLSIEVPVEAEKAGSRYNVPSGIITKSLVHIEGIDSITNKADWITKEGSDIEDLESLRTRTLRSWAELSTNPIADKYKNVCEAVDGVLFVQVNDLHPRGQGTIDIIVTGTNGNATEQLLEEVSKAADSIKGSYDNILVKSSVSVPQDITVICTVSNSTTESGIEEKVKACLIDMLKISKDRELNTLTIADIIYSIKSQVTAVRNVKVTVPTDDVTVNAEEIITAGEITVTIVRV